MGGFIVAGMVVPFVITYVNDLPASGYFLEYVQISIYFKLEVIDVVWFFFSALKLTCL